MLWFEKRRYLQMLQKTCYMWSRVLRLYRGLSDFNGTESEVRTWHLMEVSHYAIVHIKIFCRAPEPDSCREPDNGGFNGSSRRARYASQISRESHRAKI